MLRWKGTIKPAVSDALVSQMDFTASFAALTGQENKTPDSENILDAFLGKSNIGRESLLLGQSNITTYRKGNWVMIPPHDGPKIVNKFVRNETGRMSNYQLFNLQEDRGQLVNLADKHPDKIKEMMDEINAIKTKKD